MSSSIHQLFLKICCRISQCMKLFLVHWLLTLRHSRQSSLNDSDSLNLVEFHVFTVNVFKRSMCALKDYALPETIWNYLGRIGMWTSYSLAIYSGHRLQSSNLFLDHSSALLIDPLGGAPSWRSLSRWWELSSPWAPEYWSPFMGETNQLPPCLNHHFSYLWWNTILTWDTQFSHLKKCVLVSLGVTTKIP